MSVTSEAARAIAFKGRMMTLTVLQIHSADLERVDAALTRQMQRSPGFYESLPVLLSLPDEAPELAPLTALLRERGLVPVALLDPTRAQARAGRDAGLGVLPDMRARPSEPEPEKPAAQPAAQRTSRLVTTPVRSGQQIYARGGDLVVAAAVSEGAEVIADGHIHVYGALRGRALAGAAGDAQARIFCRCFEADLVAVAGHYKVADDIGENVRGRAVQVRLAGEEAGDQLLIETQE